MADYRKENLTLVVDQALAAHDEWSQSDVPYITEDLEQAIDEVIEVFANGDLPGSFRQLSDRIVAMGREWEAWKAKVSTTGQTQTLPDNGFWKAFEFVRSARKETAKRAKRQLESVAELTNQKVPDRQICQIYGWQDERGNADLQTLREEREKPGTHTGPNFIPPHERRRQEQESREAAIVARLKATRERKLERLTSPPPESLAELVKSKVSAKQIARMFHTTVDEVFQMCDEQGLPHPQAEYERPSTGPHDRVPSESDSRMNAQVGKLAKGELIEAESEMAEDEQTGTQDTADEPVADGEPMTLEQEIVYYHQLGWEARQIAEAVSTPEIKISGNKVGAVVRKWKEQQGAKTEV